MWKEGDEGSMAEEACAPEICASPAPKRANVANAKGNDDRRLNRVLSCIVSMMRKARREGSNV